MTCLWLTVAAQAQPLESVYFLLEKWLGLVPLFVSFDSLLSRGHNVERLGSDQSEMRPMISPKRTATAEYVIRLLAELSGPATRHILEREFSVFGKAEYEELSGISVSHIYNLRRSK